MDTHTWIKKDQASDSFFKIDTDLMRRHESYKIFPQSQHFDRAYRTGDFGFMENGLIYYAGRQDSQVQQKGYLNTFFEKWWLLVFGLFFKVKIRGQRADLGEIEKKVMDCLKNQVEQAIVLAIHPKQPSQKIVAFVKLFTNYQTKNVR